MPTNRYLRWYQHSIHGMLFLILAVSNAQGDQNDVRKAFLKDYCIECHGQESPKAGWISPQL